MDEEPEDWEVWKQFPQHRWVFNKLELSLKLGYLAGPTPSPVPKTADYIIRPIYNLSGLAAGAKFMHLEQEKIYNLPPSYFWCEKFHGEHLSVGYVWDVTGIKPVHSSVGETDFTNLSRFKKWYVVEHRHIELPSWIDNFRDVGKLNIEFIGGNIIEIHLRHGDYFPQGSTEVIPIWSTTPKDYIEQLTAMGYKFDDCYTTAENNIKDPRLGHMWK